MDSFNILPKGVSFGLTFIRIPLLALFLYVAMSFGGEFPSILIGIVMAIMLSDYFDGRIADYCGFESAARRLLDAAVDRIVMNAVFMGTVIFCGLPLIFYFPLLIREVLLLAGGLIVAQNRKTVIYANALPKIVNTSVAAAGISFLATGLTTFSFVLFLLSYLLLFLGLIDYLGIFLKIATSYPQVKLQVYHPERFEGIKLLLTFRFKPTTASA